MSGTVNISELECSGGFKFGIAELDNPASLNALSYEMLVVLHDALKHWHDDHNIVGVVIHGAGEKAFCAGGDVRAMYQVMNEARSSDQPIGTCQAMSYLTDYFTLEYQTDYLIHTYSKPVIVWGEGIVMGGGIGLYIGASHRITTPNTRLAMPEISIGLYPDVGGTWFLNHLPQGVGLFLGLTGATVNATDALALAMTEHIILPGQKETMFELLQQVNWDDVEPHQGVTELLDRLGNDAKYSHPQNELLPHLQAIQTACQYGSLPEIYDQIQAMAEPVDESEGKWLRRAKQTLREGSPITAHICYRQLTQFHYESLADCFRLELSLSVRCGELGEFYEGVKARLIEKTQQPRWLFSDIASVDQRVIDTLFTPLWADNEHPLQLLGLNGSHEGA
ncbi:enoyl-CoA hydratase/isomerase family protein [Photobacterium gaetbulicola]|uniref:3-hydroxyisobutyryl-CoA hydrolase n=1 Tax=Photobacterium gaetbulicola Gung47 TaxID=658445 RepID=A0A0C5WLE0_9GAMM|nr:enoyl-CoA hydratase/isomerase family protein [Photobacterium gaetbulicola]AJR05894.1 putative enoyl-CoA hydratase [Photobacterium gaetbulicola Gung47]PSU13292.1 enoyl-CoA hydratase/isomerase family protein [Photobacterium gaetbulicola]